MQRVLLFFCVIFSVPYAYHATKGLVELDEHSFEKLLAKFEAVLVKFDVAYPYGDKHEAFLELALEAKDVDELLVADVNVKDYGEKENEALAAKYGASKDTFPVVKLFKKGKSEPIPFDEGQGFSIKKLRTFVRENTGIHLPLPGCVRQLDTLVDKFMAAGDDDREKILKQLEVELTKLPEKHSASGQVYQTIMKKILEKGDSFIKTEGERVQKILKGKVSEEKKKTLNTKINILQTFHIALQNTVTQRGEL